MPETDNLDGYRADPDLTAANPEDELRARLGDEAYNVDLLIFGQQMEEFVSKHPVGRRLYEKAQVEVARCTQILFSSATLDTDRVREAHFNGRVAIAMLKMIDDAITQGIEAKRAILADDGSDTPTGDEHG